MWGNFHLSYHLLPTRRDWSPPVYTLLSGSCGAVRCPLNLPEHQPCSQLPTLWSASQEASTAICAEAEITQVWHFTEDTFQAKQTTVSEAEEAVTFCPSRTALNSRFAFRDISSAPQAGVESHGVSQLSAVSSGHFHIMQKTTETTKLCPPPHLYQLCSVDRQLHHLRNQYKKLCGFLRLERKTGRKASFPCRLSQSLGV